MSVRCLPHALAPIQVGLASTAGSRNGEVPLLVDWFDRNLTVVDGARDATATFLVELQQTGKLLAAQSHHAWSATVCKLELVDFQIEHMDYDFHETDSHSRSPAVPMMTKAAAPVYQRIDHLGISASEAHQAERELEP